MAFLTAATQQIADAATRLGSIGSAIGSSNTTATPAIAGVLPAAADEVSTQIATLFSQCATRYQQFSAAAATFHDQFVQTMTAGAGIYAAAEANSAQTMVSASTNPVNTALTQIEEAQIWFNTNLVNGELAFNQSLVTNEIAFEQTVFGTNSTLNGALNRSFNANNLLVGTGEQLVNTVFGAQVPTNFTSSLLTGTGQQVFNGGQIGGLMGAFDQSLAAGADLIGLFFGA